MKKLLALVLAVVMVLAMAACSSTNEAATEASEPAAEVMSHEEYVAADLNELVTIETYVQAHQSWWQDKITVYAQSEDGAYFLYNMPCSEEDAAKLVPGTKIRVTGYKSEWSGEVELTWDETFEGPAFEILDGSFVAEAADLTDLLGSDELIAHQNEFVTVKGLTVAPAQEGSDAAFLYNWDGSGAAGSNSDLYFNVTDGTNTYTFTVESYLCGEGTDVYTAVTELKVGDVIDLEGFLYWYNGAQMHVTNVTPAA